MVTHSLLQFFARSLMGIFLIAVCWNSAGCSRQSNSVASTETSSSSSADATQDAKSQTDVTPKSANPAAEANTESPASDDVKTGDASPTDDVPQEPIVGKPTADSFKRHIPATVTQARAVIDLSTLPRFKPTSGWNDEEILSQFERDFSNLLYKSRESPGELAKLYRQHLGEVGWRELSIEHDPPLPRSLSVIWFSKDDFLLKLMLQKKFIGGSSVNFINHGNIDPRDIPLPDNASVHLATPDVVLSKTTIAPAAAQEFFDRLLGDNGWQRHREQKKENQTSDITYLLYRRNGVRIKIRVSEDTLQVYSNLFQYDFPSVADARDVICQNKASFYTTSMPLSDIVAFYEKEFLPHGWEPRPEMRDVTEKGAQLFFGRGNGKGMIVNVATENAERKVELGILDASRFDELTEHRAVLKKAPASFLVPDNAHSVTLNEYYNTLNFRVPQTIAELAEYYQKAISDNGWKPTFEPEVSEQEAEFWYENADDEDAGLHVKITPYGPDQSEIEVNGDLKPLIVGSNK